MRLQRLTVSGLKGHDRTLDFTQPVSVLIGDNGCLSGDTLIDCPRDLTTHPRGIPMRELVGQQPWVYTWLDGRIAIRRADRVWMTKAAAATVRVALRKPGRAGKYTPPQELVGTPDHLVLLSDGVTWKALGDLVPGDRLCSMYRRESGGWRTLLTWTGAGTEFVGRRGKTRSRPVSEQQFICAEVHGPRPDDADAHHCDDNPYNHSVDNLEWKDGHKHRSEHTSERNKAGRAGWQSSGVHPRGMAGKKHTAETRARMRAAQAGQKNAMAGRVHSVETRAKISKAIRRPNPINHVVVSVTRGPDIDVFDMCVPETANFVANGVVVHNSGKTEVLQALSLLATGTTAGIPKTAEGVMRLARGDEIELRAVFDKGAVARSWKRDKKGAVKETIAGTLLPAGITGKAAAGYLSGVLGGWSEVWRPSDLYALSPAKLRARLVSLLGHDFAPADHVPADAPKWAQPHESEDLGTWIARVCEVARREANDAAADRKRIATALAEHVAQWGETLGDGTMGLDTKADLAAAQADLVRLREEWATARNAERARTEHEARRAGLAADLVRLRSVAQKSAADGVETVEEIDVSIAAEEQADAERELGEAGAHQAAVWRLVESKCPHCGRAAADREAVKAAELAVASAEDAFIRACDAHSRAASGWVLTQTLAAIRKAEAELEALEAEPPEAARALADIEADAKAAEARIALAGASGETEAARAQLEADLAKATETEDARAKTRDTFAKVEAVILDDVRERIEGPASAALGEVVTVELVDARGGATCRLAVDGVDVSAISTGEQIVFTTALLCALASGARSEWKPLVIDCLESVHATRRKAFLSALADACARGVIHQAMVAGCPDSVEAPKEGVEVMELEPTGAEAPKDEETKEAKPAREYVEETDPACRIPREPVESSAIAKIGYVPNDGDGTLVVEFPPPEGEETGAVWAYDHVDPEDAARLIEAESIGKAWGVMRKSLVGRQIAGPLPKKRRGAA